MSDLTFTPYPLAKKQSLYHLYTEKFGANGFDDSGAHFRFSPIELENGKFLPTYYAAIQCADAMAETIIRRYRHKPTLTWHMPSETVDMIEKKEAKAVAQVSPARDMELIDLETLKGKNGKNPIGGELKLGTSAYKKLRDTAKYLYENYRGFDGLTWYGYQMRQPGYRCMIFFGDAVKPEDLDIDWSGLMRETHNLHRLYDALITTDTSIPSWLAKMIDT